MGWTIKCSNTNCKADTWATNIVDLIENHSTCRNRDTHGNRIYVEQYVLGTRMIPINHLFSWLAMNQQVVFQGSVLRSVGGR